MNVLRREPVAAAAVDGLPSRGECTEQACSSRLRKAAWTVYTPLRPAADKRVLPDKRLQSYPISVPQQKSACGRVNCSSGQSAKSMSRTSGESGR